MKILLSPSKTMNPANSMYLQNRNLLFPKQHQKILSKLKIMNKQELSKALSIKDDILNTTYHNIRGYDLLESYHAFTSFTGLVYKNIDKESYRQEEYNYIQNHLLILDAFYGILEPGTTIKPYRLDMKAKIGFNLYAFWDVNSLLEEELIINLASKEFSEMISVPMVTVHFLQLKNGVYINQATYSKQARGLFFDFLVKNKLHSINEMIGFNSDGYTFNSDLSDENNLTFTR